VGELAPGEADDVVSSGAEVEVPFVVVLEGLSTTVEAVAVRFDGDP